MSASTEKKNRQLAREAGIDKKALAAQEEARKKAKEKRKWAIGTSLTVLLIAAVLFINSGFLTKNTTAISIDGESYSPAEASFHMASQYMNWANQNGSYASLFGLDTSNGISGLDSQECPMLENGTWLDYFMQLAEQEMIQVQALCKYAEENGISLTEEEIAEIDSSLASTESYAQLMGYQNAKSFYAMNYGEGVTAEIVRTETLRGSLANKVLTQYSDSLSYTAAELEEHYQGFEGEQDVYSYSYYYVAAAAEDNGNGGTEVTDKTRREAKNTAEAILATYESAVGVDVATRMDAAVAAHVTDAKATHPTAASGASLGIYKDWLSQQTEYGAATVVESDNGCYVLAFSSRSDNHYPMAQVRHILVKAQANENGEYTDAAKEVAKAEAEELLNQWKSGEASEDSFAALAEVHSEDTGSNTNGGLYDDVAQGQMVKEFNDFCFAEGRQAGDTAIVYGESGSYAGYHVMYYVGQGEQYSDYLAKNDLRNTDLQDFLTAQTEGLEAVHGAGYRFI